MKKMILLLNWMLITCINTYGQSSSMKEDSVDLSKNAISMSDGGTYIRYAKNNILTYTGSSTDTYRSVSSTIFVLNNTNITTLRKAAYTYAPSIPPTGYVTAIEIRFGICANDSLDLYIRPLYLERGSNISKNRYFYTYSFSSIEQSSPYYRLYPNGSMYRDITNQSARDCKKYKDSIVIYHYYNDPAHSYNSILNDDTTIVYSFQELNALMNANINASRTQPDTSLLLLSIGYLVPVHAPIGVYPIMRHDILLSPPGIGSNSPGANPQQFTANEYADIGNLCPPECPCIGSNGAIFNILSGTAGKK